MSQQDQQTDDIKGALLASIGEVETASPGSTGKLAEYAPKAATQEQPAADTAADSAAKAGEQSTATGNQSTDGRARDATGKFIPKDSAEAAKPADATKSATSAKTDAVQQDAAPGSLPDAVKAKWGALDPDVRAFLVQREKEMGQAGGKAGAELRQLKTQYEPIEQLLSPRRAAVVAQHGSVESWLKQVLDYSDFAGADPEGFLSWYLSQPNIGSRVDLNKLLGVSQDGAQRSPTLATDPTVKALQQELTGLKSRLQQYEGQSQAQQQNSIVSELDAFEQEKDASNQPKYPHFATLRDAGILLPEMHLVRQSNPNLSFRQILATAYENAMWKHSDTRNAVLQSQQKQAQEEKEAKERAEAASRARKFVTGQPPGRTAPADAPKENLRDEIAAAFYAHSGGTRL